MPDNSTQSNYGARQEYLDEQVVDDYESYRFASGRGAYVWKREQGAVGRMIAAVGSAGMILDCPGGTGRWGEVLDRLSPSVLLAADISPTMLAAYRKRRPDGWRGVQAEAERLPFADGSVDLVFSHALTKHLPVDVQGAVLREFARVSRGHVICSFSVLQGLPGLIRRVRHAQGAVAVTRPWVLSVAASAGLTLLDDAPCTTPIGVERTMLFRVNPRAAAGA